MQNINFIAEIGSGNFGTVSKVLRQNEKTPIALKIFNSSDSSQKIRIKQVFNHTKKMTHPNLVKIIDWYEDEGNSKFGFFMEFVKGKELSKIKHKSLGEILALGIQICSGLEELHSKGIVHRDLKPSNILVTKNQTVKITDFDLIKIQDGNLTMTGDFLGTLKYSSPEIRNDSKNIDYTSDLYSLGVMFYELVTGILPFQQTSSLWDESSIIVSPKKHKPNLPVELEKLILKLLEQEPILRPSAQEVAKKLIKIKKNLSPLSQTNEHFLRPVKFVGRNKILNKLVSVSIKSNSQKSPNFYLILGEEGIGKSNLLNRFKVKIPNSKTNKIIQLNLFEEIDLLTLLKTFYTQLSVFLSSKNKDYLFEQKLFNSLIGNTKSNFSVQDKIYWNSLFRIFEFLNRFHFTIFIDDFHYANQETKNFINFFWEKCNEEKSIGVLIVATTTKKLGFNFSNPIQKIKLNGLTQNETTEFIQGALGTKIIQEEILESIFLLSNGNPIFLREILHTFLDKGFLTKRKNKWVLEISEEPKIPTLNEIFEKSIASFSKEEIDALIFCSTTKKLFSVKLVSKLMQKEPEIIQTQFEKFTTNGIFKQISKESFTFSKSFYKQNLEIKFQPTFSNYQTKTLLFFEQNPIFPNAIEELAYLSEKLQIANKVVAYNLQFADQLRLNSFFDEALKYYLSAQKYFNEVENSQDKFCVQLGLVEILLEKAEWQKALNEVETLIKFAQEAGDKLLLAKSLWLQAKTNIYQGNIELGIEKLNLAQELVPKTSSSEIEKLLMELIVLTSLSVSFGMLKKIRETEKYLEKAELLYQKILKDKSKLNSQNRQYLLKVGFSILMKKGNSHFISSNYKDAEKYYLACLNLAQEENYLNGVSKAMLNLSAVFIQREETSKALSILNEKISIDKIIDSKSGMATCFGNKGIIYLNSKNFAKATFSFENQIKLAVKIGDEELQIKARNNCGIVQEKIGEFDKAIEIYSQIISEFKTEYFEIQNVKNNLANLLQRVGNFKEAEKIFQELLLVYRSKNYTTQYAIVLGNLGTLKIQEFELDKAKDFLKRAKSIFYEIEDKRNYFKILFQLAKVYFLLGNFSKSQNCINESKEFTRETKEKELLINFQILEAKILSKESKINEAVELLLHLEKEVKNDEQLALIYFTLFKTSHKINYKLKAKSLYRKLNSKTPNIEFENKINELESPSSNTVEKFNSMTLESLIRNSKLSEIYDIFLKNLSELFEIEKGLLLKISDKTKVEFLSISDTFSSEEIIFSKSILYSAIKEGKAKLVPNAKRHHFFAENLSVISKEFLSVIIIPIKFDDTIDFALYLDRQNLVKEFNYTEFWQIEKIFKSIIPFIFEQFKENIELPKPADKKFGFFIGNSPQMQSVYRSIEKFSKNNFPVHIFGNTGTGKELVAQSIHKLSNRKGKFIPINCSTIPEKLAESELFGHEKGSFSGATSIKKGKFELASQGTLFLDEIGDLPLAIQTKLLRTIQENKIWRIGGDKEISVDVRIISATNKNLEEEVRKGNFREDLFFRINVIDIFLPTLTNRKQDILPLATHFLEKCSDGKKSFSTEAKNDFLSYSWPGNVRELQKVVYKATVLTDSNIISNLNLSNNHQTLDERNSNLNLIPFIIKENKTLDEYYSETLKIVLPQILAKNLGNKTLTAKELNISKTTLLKLIKNYIS